MTEVNKFLEWLLHDTDIILCENEHGVKRPIKISNDKLLQLYKTHCKNSHNEIKELEAARLSYANELGVKVNSIHEKIRTVKTNLFRLADEISNDGISYPRAVDEILSLAKSLKWKPKA